MKAQNTFQRACAWSGLVTLAMFFGAFLLSDFVPLLSPDASAQEIARHYQEHTTGIRLGSCIMLLSGAFYAVYTAVISAQMRRIPGVQPAAVYAQLSAGSFGCLTFLVPAMFFAVTAFRPDRDPADTLMLNDLSWVLLIMPVTPFMAQNFSFAFAVLSDRGAVPLFPRWLGYVNIWAPLMLIPEITIPFFKTGPLAWDGLLAIYVPSAVVITQFILNTRQLLRAIGSDDGGAGYDGKRIAKALVADA